MAPVFCPPGACSWEGWATTSCPERCASTRAIPSPLRRREPKLNYLVEAP